MARYPGAVWRPLPTTCYNAGARTAQLGLILHVQQGNNSPFGWYCNPVSKASSTFWVSKTGVVEQYMEAGTDKSWAQSAGNSSYDSVETEGYVGEPLTGAQIAALADLCAWEHAAFGMPLVAIESPGQRGLGWHGMGGAAWGGHYGCPGDVRKAQRAQILGVATVSNTTTTGGAIPTAPGALTATPPEDDMGIIDAGQWNTLNAKLDEIKALTVATPDGVWRRTLTDPATGEQGVAEDRVTWMDRRVRDLAARASASGNPDDLTPLLDAIKALPEQTVAAIKAAL